MTIKATGSDDFPTRFRGFDEVHDDGVCSFGINRDLISERVSHHHRHTFPGGVEAQCVQQLEIQLPQVRQLHRNLVREAPNQGALVSPGSVDQRSLIRRLCLVAQLSFLRVPGGFSVVGGWIDGEGVLQGAGELLLV